MTPVRAAGSREPEPPDRPRRPHLRLLDSDAAPPRHDEPLRDGRLRDGRLRDGPLRDGPLRDGPLCDGPLRDGSLRDGPLRDEPLRDEPRPKPPATSPRRGILATTLSAAGSWLLEPVEPGGAGVPPLPPEARPVAAVFGLARGCGATVVARALAAELARRDPAGAGTVSCGGRAAGVPLASRQAARLARVLGDMPGAVVRASGRLCLVHGADPTVLVDTARHHAPLVLDAGSAAIGGVPASLADHLIVVATPRVEPALASVAAAALGRVGPEPIIVLNRGAPDDRWHARAHVHVPDSRMGAQLAAGGREARGALGAGIEHLADLCQGVEAP